MPTATRRRNGCSPQRAMLRRSVRERDQIQIKDQIVKRHFQPRSESVVKPRSDDYAL